MSDATVRQDSPGASPAEPPDTTANQPVDELDLSDIPLQVAETMEQMHSSVGLSPQPISTTGEQWSLYVVLVLLDSTMRFVI